MKDIKDSNPGAPNGDPFADLVRVVEGSSLRSPESGESTYAGFEPHEVPASQWDQFTYQPVSVSSQFGGSLGRAAPIVDPSDRSGPVGKHGRSGLISGPKASAETDFQIDDALRGLSQPARPRDTIPAETQSFAPARSSEFDHEPHQTITLDDFDELIASELAVMQPSPPQPVDEDEYALGFDESDADDNFDDDYQPVAPRSRFRLPIVLLGGAATLALIAVAGAVIYSGLPGVSAGGEGPLLITADSEPYKIAPADPGGRSIPNQNKAVYQRVAGGAAPNAPAQQSLVTAMEEPMDIAEEEDPPVDDLPGVSVGDELSMSANQPQDDTQVADAKPDESAVLQPRKVRTLTVRPDGTLVANEGPPMAGGEPALLPTSNTVAQAAVLDPVAGIQPTLPFATDSASLTTASTEPVAALAPPPAAPEAKPEPAETQAPPPAAEPMPVPTETETKTAALEPAAAPAIADGYFVQISSQPSEALAKESQANLTRRYASVIGKRSVGIVEAKISGKGTYYRVRVSAASKSEANTLCENLKSAGGSCFVTR